MCVFCAHAGRLGNLSWLTGDIAVECFFVISGFYMQLVLHDKYTKERLGHSWVRQFYQARYLRLFPIYFMTVIAVSAVSLWRDDLLLETWRSISALPETIGNFLFKAFLLFTNITMLFQDLVMFLAVNGGEVHWTRNFLHTDVRLWTGLAVQQAWSLGIEISFYLLAPWLLNWRSRWLVLAAAGGLVLKIAAIKIGLLGDPWTYRFFPFELGYFLLGALACRYRARLDGHAKLHLGKYWYAIYPVVFAFAAVNLHLPFRPFSYPVVLALLLPLIFNLTSQSKVDRVIGEASYPFYIVHLFALGLVQWALQSPWPPGGATAAAWLGLVLTLALSAVLLALETYFIEPWRARLAEPSGGRAVSATLRQNEPGKAF